MNPEKFSEEFEKIMSRMIEIAKANKELHSNPATARHWAIFGTELEKLYAFYKTYLSDSKGNS